MITQFIKLTNYTKGSELYYNISHIDLTKLQYNGRYTSIIHNDIDTLVKETPEQIIKLIEEKK